ncbi:MAG: rod shape-determining protein RodA [Acidobacteria bacterium]|nr:rod shape-determining protein RodA [Acidobacteriota bacterium]
MSLIDRRFLSVYDFGTLAVLGALLGIGVILVASASDGQQLELAQRQAVWVVAGLALALVISFIDYRNLTDNGYLLWGGVIVLLVAVLFFGPVIKGARSWIRFGGFGLQPSELAKIAAIVALARLFSDRDPRPFGLRQMVMPSVLVAVPVLLIALQPDMGTAATFLPILAIIAFAAGLRYGTIGWLAGGALAVTPLWYMTLHDYQQRRLTSFWNPDADPQGDGYQLIQSKIAVGSGGLSGKGLFSGSQSQLNFLPEQENDFIMALLGEELGFIGVLAVLVLYFILISRILRGAYIARDRAGAFLCAGVGGLLTFHLVVNVGMIIGFVPITGIPLPLLSYGGSSALATCIAVGLVVSVRSRRFLV